MKWLGRAFIASLVGTVLYAGAALGQLTLLGVGSAGGGKNFVAVGVNGGVSCSPTGTAWTYQTLGAFTLNRVIYANGQYVIGGNSTGTTAALFRSSDCKNWTQTTVLATSACNVTGLAYGAGLYVIGCGAGAIFTSPDFITFTLQTTGATGTVRRGVFGGSQFVFGVTNGAGAADVLTSPDGIMWTLTASAFPNATQGISAYSGSLYMAGGNASSTNQIYQSSNGTTFNPSTGTGFTTTAGGRTTAFGIGLYFAADNIGELATSATGLSSSWTLQTSGFSGNSINGMTCGTSLCAVAGANGIITTTPDGSTFTGQTSGFGTDIINDITNG